jgi:CheY-like chemotaxis protein
MDYIIKHYHTLRNQPFESLHGTTVLLVEPEPETRSFYSQQLRDIGMEVRHTDALINMLTAVQEAQPDVVIVNPSEDMAKGSRLIRTLKQYYSDLPVITMSKAGDEAQIDAIMEAGVSLHINRGLTRPRDLLLALEQVILKK